MVIKMERNRTKQTERNKRRHKQMGHPNQDKKKGRNNSKQTQNRTHKFNTCLPIKKRRSPDMYKLQHPSHSETSSGRVS